MSEINWETRESALEYDQHCDHQFHKGTTLFDMMHLQSGDHILDLGCGTGRLAEYIAAIIGPSGQLTGIDPSSHRIEIFRKRFEKNSFSNADFRVGQAEDLTGVLDHYYHHVLFCSSFHWVDDKPAALREVYRVLRVGGTIGMTTLNRGGSFLSYDVVNEVLSRYGLPACQMHGHDGMKRVTREELQEHLSDAGFSEIFIEQRMISGYHNSPSEVMEKKGPGSFSDNISHLSESVQQEIRCAILREYDKRKGDQSSEAGPGTLFAIARK